MPNKQKNGQAEMAEFEGLEPLLRKCLNDKQLRVIDCAASKLLPAGENYCSVIVKLEVTIRRGGDATEDERLHLVAKAINVIERPIVDWKQVSRKEIFMYARLIPVYRELEREMGIEETDLLNLLPQYVGHRYSLDPHSEKDDDYSLLLMENIKALGYYTCDRLSGVDLEHARLALQQLARYHALGIVLKHRRPDFFKAAQAQARILGINLNLVTEGLTSIRPIFRDNPCFAKHLPMIETSFGYAIDDNPMLHVEPEEPWSTITHGDFWVNNILFRKDASGRVDDVKFVDFQLYLYASPLKDLPYFFCGSLNDDAIDRHFDELLDIYYHSFIGTLKRAAIDTEPFDRQSFDREIKKQAIYQFPLSALAIKFFIFEVEQDQLDNKEILQSVLKSQFSQAYRDKLLQVVNIYEKKGWF